MTWVNPYSEPSRYRSRELVVEDASFFVHPTFLAERSKYFQILLEGDFMEKNEQRIQIKGEKASDFIQLLNSLGADPDKDREPVTAVNVLPLLRLADKYDFPILLQRCMEFVLSDKVSDVSIEDTILILKFGIEFRYSKDFLSAIVTHLASFSSESLKESTLLSQISDAKLILVIFEQVAATHGVDSSGFYYSSTKCPGCTVNNSCLRCGFCQRSFCSVCYAKKCSSREIDSSLLSHLFE